MLLAAEPPPAPFPPFLTVRRLRTYKIWFLLATRKDQAHAPLCPGKQLTIIWPQHRKQSRKTRDNPFGIEIIHLHSVHEFYSHWLFCKQVAPVSHKNSFIGWTWTWQATSATPGKSCIQPSFNHTGRCNYTFATDFVLTNCVSNECDKNYYVTLPNKRPEANHSQKNQVKLVTHGSCFTTVKCQKWLINGMLSNVIYYWNFFLIPTFNPEPLQNDSYLRWPHIKLNLDLSKENNYALENTVRNWLCSYKLDYSAFWCIYSCLILSSFVNPFAIQTAT